MKSPVINSYSSVVASRSMRTKSVFFALLLLGVAAAQQPTPKRMIYGTVIGQDGEPAKGIYLAAEPLGGSVSSSLPHTKTNDAGEYQFENLYQWGPYAIYADDKKAGYSLISTGPASNIEITPENPKAELNLHLGPRAGFIQIHLKNRSTGTEISKMAILVDLMEKPDSFLFRMSCSSDQLILVPPDKNLLLHIKSDGFREWDESNGPGKPVNVPSGSFLTLDIELDPLH